MEVFLGKIYLGKIVLFSWFRGFSKFFEIRNKCAKFQFLLDWPLRIFCNLIIYESKLTKVKTVNK